MFQRRLKTGPLPPTANPYPSRLQRWRQKVRTVGPAFLAVILGLALVVRPSVLEPVNQKIMGAFVAVAEFATAPIEGTQLFVERVATLWDVQQKYENLQSRYADLEMQLMQAQRLAFENQQLRAFTHAVPSDYEFVTLPVRIHDRGQHSFFVALNDPRVEKGMAVLSPKGVIGRIGEISGSTARVDMITHAQSRIPVSVMTSSGESASAIMTGANAQKPKLVYVDEDILDIGNAVVTSGVGGVFPPGLPVGHVYKTKHGKPKVQPSGSVDGVSYVQVMIPSEGV